MRARQKRLRLHSVRRRRRSPTVRPTDPLAKKPKTKPRPPAQASGTLLLAPADQIPGTGTPISRSRAIILFFFSRGETRQGEFPASRSGFVSSSTSRCYSPVCGALCFLWVGVVVVVVVGDAGDRSQNKGVFGWSGGMSEPRLALPFAFLKAGQMPL